MVGEIKVPCNEIKFNICSRNKKNTFDEENLIKLDEDENKRLDIRNKM